MNRDLSENEDEDKEEKKQPTTHSSSANGNHKKKVKGPKIKNTKQMTEPKDGLK